MYKASIIAGLCCLLSGMVQAATDQPTDLRLEEVQQELKKRQANLEKRQQQQKQALSQLKSTELTLAQQAKTLHQTRQSIENNREQQTHLNQQQKTLTAQRSEQQDILAAQLQSHFMAGGSDYLKMLLNQQDPSKMERTLIYFEYLNEARVNALDALQRTEIKLQQVAEQLIAKAHQLQELLGQQSKEQELVAQQQSQHQQLIVQINKSVKSEQDSIELLKDSEQQLKNLLDKTLKLQSTVTLTGLQKGKIAWPIKGVIRHHYNTTRQGQVRWKGVLMASANGEDVRAIANGKVLFSDWVKGMGLVMVLDHGQDFITIYGHAQTLLHQAGDDVRVGDTIALVGQSGGQSEPALYFEMRHKGQTINPSQWCD